MGPPRSVSASPSSSHCARLAGRGVEGVKLGIRCHSHRDARLRQADCLFLRLMIRHHEGAIPMAEAILDLGSEPRVLQVAETIRAGQTAEIDAMQGMQQRLTCIG